MSNGMFEEEEITFFIAIVPIDSPTQGDRSSYLPSPGDMP